MQTTAVPRFSLVACNLLSNLIKILILFILVICNYTSLYAKHNNINSTNTQAQVFKLIKQKSWPIALKAAKSSGNAALVKIILAEKYKNHKAIKEVPFSQLVGFVRQNPDWPNINLIRCNAENSITGKTNKKEVYDWFKTHAPMTSNGYKFYAITASKYLKNEAKLKKIVKDGWINGSFGTKERKNYYARYKKYLTRQDHILRIDNAILLGRMAEAKSNLIYVSAPWKKSFKAQMALRQKASHGEAKFKKIAKKYYTDGLVYHYLMYHKNNPPFSSKIKAVMKAAPKHARNASRFWKVQSYIAREHIDKKNWRNAYNVVTTHFAKSAGDYSDAEFLAGWLALRFLKKPKAAAGHFQKFNKVVKSPISKARGHYWLGRANAAMRQKAQAEKHYNLASSRYGHVFYGQLATIELGKSKIKLPEHHHALGKPDAETYNKLSDISKATLLVAKYSSSGLAQNYINATINSKKAKGDIIPLAAHFKEVSCVHRKAWLGKKALQKNIFLPKYAYPMPYKLSHLPVENALTYSIIRQESVFDQSSISSANAMGLMQLIKSTACRSADKLSMQCKPANLTRNAKYNLMLGTKHLSEMINYYRGSYILAISSYNAGEHNVNKWLKRFGDPRLMKSHHQVIDWLELIPFYETRNYTQRVLENLQIYRALQNKNGKMGQGGKLGLLDDLTSARAV